MDLLPDCVDKPNEGRSNKGNEKHEMEIEERQLEVKQANTNIRDFFMFLSERETCVELVLI